MRKAINCLKICAFILLTLLIGFNIQKVVSPKFTSSQGMQSGFKNEKSNSVDVLFLGTSNMFHTINPLVLYEDTGITSFFIFLFCYISLFAVSCIWLSYVLLRLIRFCFFLPAAPHLSKSSIKGYVFLNSMIASFRLTVSR